ncbi:MAG: response regulator, partial [Chloroflexi bacterium]|nr:response regulator [Chloroflexota bacterium]
MKEKTNILVIDDDPDLQATVKTLLESKSYQVIA